MGCGFAVQKLKTARLQAEENIIFVDTSAIIDGRIVDLYMTGFIQKRLVVPDCVVDELQRLADSNDGTKRSKGKRGLDILNTMKERFGSGIEVNKYNYGTIIGVDNRLIMLCEHNANTILTVDYNLNRSAKVRGIHVLNVNELCNVLKPVALPGDTLNVTVMKEGKEQGQGVGFLDDGTMIVIENGRKYIGENISIQVTTALQTDAGRLIFGRHA